MRADGRVAIYQLRCTQPLSVIASRCHLSPRRGKKDSRTLTQAQKEPRERAAKEGKSVGIHLEPGPDGGLVMLDDTTVLDRALKILDEINMSMQKEQATEPMQI